MALDFAVVSATDQVLSGAHHIMPVIDSRTLPGDTVDFPMVSTMICQNLLGSKYD